MSGPEGHRYEYMYLGPNGNPAHWVAEDEAPVEESQPDDSSAPMEELESMVKRIPAGYIGETKDAVDAALYLLSDEARYVNGSNIQLSGGWGL